MTNIPINNQRCHKHTLKKCIGNNSEISIQYMLKFPKIFYSLLLNLLNERCSWRPTHDVFFRVQTFLRFVFVESFQIKELSPGR